MQKLFIKQFHDLTELSRNIYSSSVQQERGVGFLIIFLIKVIMEN